MIQLPPALVETMITMASYGSSPKRLIPWIDDIEPKHMADIVVYRPACEGYGLRWNLLKKYEDRALFLGTYLEADDMQERTGVSLGSYEYSDYAEAAAIIAGSKLFIGALSECYVFAEALDHPRVIDSDEFVPITHKGHVKLTERLIDVCLKGNGIGTDRRKHLSIDFVDVRFGGHRWNQEVKNHSLVLFHGNQEADNEDYLVYCGLTVPDFIEDWQKIALHPFKDRNVGIARCGDITIQSRRCYEHIGQPNQLEAVRAGYKVVNISRSIVNAS